MPSERLTPEDGADCGNKDGLVSHRLPCGVGKAQQNQWPNHHYGKQEEESHAFYQTPCVRDVAVGGEKYYSFNFQSQGASIYTQNEEMREAVLHQSSSPYLLSCISCDDRDTSKPSGLRAWGR